MNAKIRNAILLSCAAALPAVAWAQTAPPGEAAGQLEDIVITAQKRTERLQDVPVSAAVVSSDTITSHNVTDISDLNNMVPSVNLNGSYNGRVPMGMRGISSVSNEGTVGLSSGVAILVDGVPVPSDSVDGNQLEDIQSVEVLKGPQATLGGRTAASGVINIVTKGTSNVWTGDVNAVATDDQEYRANGHIAGPISDFAEFSLSAYDTTLNQPVKNLYYDQYSNQKIAGGRGKVKFKFGDDFDVTLMAHYNKTQTTGFNFAYTYITPGTTLLVGPGGPPFLSADALLPGITPSMYNTNYSSPVHSGADITDTDFSAVINYRLGGGFTLSSITAYQHEKQDNLQDLFAVNAYFWNELTGAGTPGNPTPPFNNLQEQLEVIKQFSEEIKLVSPATDSFNYVVGLFYSDTKVDTTETRTLLPAFNNTHVVPDTKTTDIYARSTWKFLPTTSLVTGLRYNADKVSYTVDQALFTAAFPPPVIQGPISDSGSHSGSATVGDISIQQQLAKDSMVYATYARGYSPGAYNTTQAILAPGLLGPGTPGSPHLAYVPNETIDHFEIGTKGTYFDNTLSLNVAVWDTKYKNFQVQIFDTSTGSINPPLILTPAGAAETKGLELDLNWAATALLRVNFSYAYVDAKFNDYTGAPCWYGQNTLGTGCTPKLGVGTTVSPTNPLIQDLSGAVMPNAPKNKFVLGAQQRVPLGSSDYELLLAGTYSYTASAQMLADQNPQTIRPSFGLLNLSVGIRPNSGKFSVTAFVNNVLNKHYVVDLEDFWSSPWGSTNVVVGQPARDTNRYAGLRVSAGF